ncbi:RluA family pseudouridine synthase [Paenibacillus tarimensis]|uniref:RluA family pseudouridine synthase n=1 Tax=Paenibacillus tarimensis TaxID=416012 RepID=UPI001F29F8AA|nr:RluA family pseudouridine synthase [Paenibacillus tarimensis]
MKEQMILDLQRAVKEGEWIAIPLPAVLPEGLEAGSHPHDVRKWLLALAAFPDKWVNRLFSVGGIRLDNGRLLLKAYPHVDLAAHPLLAGAPGSMRAAGGMDAPSILYEDDHCLVADKPSGMAVHPSRPGHYGTLDEWVLRHALMRGQATLLRHIHRLDDDTAGPVLYAKHDLAQWRLDEAMRDKRIDRRYEALVEGPVKRDTGTVNAPIGKDRHHRSRRRITPEGDHAVTHYEVLHRTPEASLVTLQLETGRTHQIRVHMAHLGHPLIGDTLYGARRCSSLTHQALHGKELSFPHPWLSHTVTVYSVRPAWWTAAAQELGLL